MGCAGNSVGPAPVPDTIAIRWNVLVARVTLLDRLNDSTGERGRLGAVARVTLLDRLRLGRGSSGSPHLRVARVTLLDRLLQESAFELLNHMLVARVTLLDRLLSSAASATLAFSWL